MGTKWRGRSPSARHGRGRHGRGRHGRGRHGRGRHGRGRHGRASSGGRKWFCSSTSARPQSRRSDSPTLSIRFYNRRRRNRSAVRSRQGGLSRASTPSPQRAAVQTRIRQDQAAPVQPRSQSPPQHIRAQDITTCQCLYYGDYIGNETRTVEFKKGSRGYMEDIFHGHIHKYGCAFLNSGGGSLLIGVNDDGVVCGVCLTHKMEDNARLQVDWAVKSFRPPLLPCNYSLDFLPVIKSTEERDLKVLRLTFRAPLAPAEPTLFDVNKGNVYLRLDGSVHGPLATSDIIQWYREMWSDKVQQLQQCLREAIAEKYRLAGQVEGMLQSIWSLHQIIDSLQVQMASSAGLQQHSPLSAWLSSVNSAYHTRALGQPLPEAGQSQE